MKALLVSLNAKFIHSSLALRYIYHYCKPYQANMDILELTINHDESAMINEIYEHQPSIIGFSCYIWNMEQIANMIPILKQIMPNVKIALGGPEVSYNSKTLFETLPIDLIVEGEGEVVWYEYMSYLLDGVGTLNDIEGILYRNEEGQVIRNPKREPMDMATLPFVYDELDGLEHKIMYYEASRGCPFNCQYCLSSAEKGVRFLPLERIKEELKYFLDHDVKQIKFVDRTFNTKKKMAMDIWQYLIENDNGKTNFHFEIAAELLDDDMFELLKGARDGLIQFEIGVQSTNPDVLKLIKRPMPFEAIKEIVLKLKALGNIHQHLDLIAGLPLENYASFRNSFNDVFSLRPEQFQLGFLKLLRGSGLRERAEELGIVYRPRAPYEVLYTREISFDELNRLHHIEEMVEKYYNSERFHSSLEYLYTHFETPFDFFEGLAGYFKEMGYHKVPHKKAGFYTILADFGMTIESINQPLLKELIRFDWFKHEQVKEMPEVLVTLEQSSYKNQINQLLRNDEVMIQTFGVDESISSRQRLRRMHVEWFSYNPHTLKKQMTPVLFDYTGKSNYQMVEEEVWDEIQGTH